MDVEVAIIGGGLAGLFTAVELRRRGVDDVAVLEAADLPGGVIRTQSVEGYSLEPAAGTLLLPHPRLGALLETIGAATEPAAPAAAVRRVYTRGRLVAITASPRAALAPVVGPGSKLRAAVEPFIRARPKTEDESLHAFMVRRLGKGLGSLVAGLAAAGVFAGDPESLSARSAFPGLVALEDEAGSIVGGALRRLRGRGRHAARPSSHLPIPDMSAIADAAASHIDGRFIPGFTVTSVRSEAGVWRIEGSAPVTARHLILACGPHVSADLVGADLPDLSAGLRRGVTAPVAVVWLGGRTDDVPLPSGFGALTGPDTGLSTLGALFESSYAPRRAPKGHSLCKAIVGGARHPAAAALDDDRLIAMVTEEVSRILGRTVVPDFVRIHRHHRGIPQYDIAHGKWLQDLAESTPPGLHLAGWGYRGVGVAHLAGDAVALAGAITGPANQ